MNHTSDRHPWFQEARRPGSPRRDWYVWSDSDRKYAGARIIFSDAEPSNWTWDPSAGAYYWHRFYSHQPDLNFDNPEVREAMKGVARFWLGRGVDGFRVDAAPYLFEREGTDCENLPETHAFLKELRGLLDAEYPGRILLAEANQEPEGLRSFFGDGDECQMAFHFPLMTALFLALARGDRGPIEEVLRRTPPLPPGGQWALFLRNHDELTLEKATPEEREELRRAYAPEPRMRLNLGIRRRLAPLLGSDRRRLAMASALLMALPGSPVLYYGDEIAMGDDLRLPDRDGVRLPMEWAEAGRQDADPASLLNEIRRLALGRRRLGVFGSGSFAWAACDAPAVAAILRQEGGRTVLAVHNLSASSLVARLEHPLLAGLVLGDGIEPGPRRPGRPGTLELPLGPYGYRWLHDAG